MDFKCTSQRLIAIEHQKGRASHDTPMADRHEFKFVALNDKESKLRIIEDSFMAYSVGNIYRMRMEAK